MKNLFRLFLLTLLSASFIVACSDDEKTTTEPEVTEFVAEYSDFAGYRDWDKIAENSGQDPALGEDNAHGNAMTRRVIYTKNKDVKMVNGEWPVGTILVKDMYSLETSELTGVMAMVKRGADFNPDHKGWEWFELNDTDKSITGRDANMMGGMCNQCHGGASSDYSFTLINE